MKYTKQERLEIGRQIYQGELTQFSAAKQYDINPSTAREYMRLYRDTMELEPKGSARKYAVNPYRGDSELLDLENLDKDELIKQIVASRIENERLKKGYWVKGVGRSKEYMIISKVSTR